MKQIYLIVVGILCLSSCVEEKDVSGLWYIKSLTDESGDSSDYGFNFNYLSFQADSVTIIYDTRRGNSETRYFAYTLTDTSLVVGETIYHAEFSDSSIKLKSTETPVVELHLNKVDAGFYPIPERFLDIPLILERENGEGVKKLSLISDSILQVENEYECVYSAFGEWNYFQLNEIGLLYSEGYMPLFVITDTSYESVQLQYPFFDEKVYYLRKYEPPLDEGALIGDWLEMNGSTDSLSESRMLRIESDSLLFGNNVKKRWKLDLNCDCISFIIPHNYENWTLLSYEKDQLTVSINDSSMISTDTIYFKRIK